MGVLHKAVVKCLLFSQSKLEKVEMKDEYYNREYAQKQNHLHQESLVVMKKWHLAVSSV